MRLWSRYLLLSLAIVAAFAAGCSSIPPSLFDGRSITQIEEVPQDLLTTADDPSFLDNDNSVIAAGYSGSDDDFSTKSKDVATSSELETSSAVSMSDQGLTLAAIEQKALANNPAIHQAQAATAKVRGIRTQVGLKPNPTIGYDGAQLGDAGIGQNSFFVEQTFVRGDKLAYNQQVIEHDVKAMERLVATQRQRLLTDIRLVFYEALAAQKRLELSQQFHKDVEKAVNISVERLKADVGSKPDILQSEIQLNEIELIIQQAEFEFSAAWQELVALAGTPDLAASELVGELIPLTTTRDADTEFAQISANSPLLAAAQARVDRAKANIQRQRVQPIPNVTALLGFGHDEGTGEEFVNLQIGMPLPIHNMNQGNIRAAQADYREARQNVERIRLSIRRDLAHVMREYQISDATVRLYHETILPKAKDALEMVQEAEAVGEFDFLRVLTTRRAYFDANFKYVTALGKLAQANSRLDGLLLTGGLSSVASYQGDDSLRGQALNDQ
ncbi:MAG: TolC family protein [Planctomycetaceae bacterium]